MAVQTSSRPQVVIVGAGFGGLQAAKKLARVPVDLVVIDRQNHHCFQPLLYQVATAELAPSDIAWAIRGILRPQRNTRVLMAEVTAVDVTARRVRTEAAEIPYDYLVLATGATHSYFGHDEWEGCAPGLKRIEDATEIRRRILLGFERAELIEDEAKRSQLLTFVVIGGGPTGVEMAGSIAVVARETLKADFRRIDPRAARVVLIEAGPRILPSFPENLASYAHRALERMGVEVMTSSTVTHCDREGVAVGDNRIAAATIIWAAGVMASPAAAWIGAEHDRAGRVKVGPDLSVPGRPEIFVIGDTATLADGPPIPGIAPAAKQMGKYVAKVIAARVRKSEPPKPFRYRHYGNLAAIGRKAAIVSMDRLRLTGFIGWVFWCIAHIYFLIGLRNRFVVAATWVWSYVTFKRAARLITSPKPRSITRE
jgi:NADH:ubiquinone reductase (H+-translocating)